ncbi:hypothetical protein N7493_004049 [Penicillium malachiteum]|uniref:Uncharacterized protein n=1 Tax=Penicillium malachiteum TaxID=1324776 RepID=A0AAD6HQU5_9EURO|nr:hypothetical protein N7493_004049 [Penicillium malachiteum]
MDKFICQECEDTGILDSFHSEYCYCDKGVFIEGREELALQQEFYDQEEVGLPYELIGLDSEVLCSEYDEEGEYSSSNLWRLGTAAVKELRGLSIYGEPGRLAAEATSEDSLVNDFSAMAQTVVLPLDQADFNRYHHGGKVNKQDQDHVRACIEYAEAEGNI